jgi:hypothetical protein
MPEYIAFASAQGSMEEIAPGPASRTPFKTVAESCEARAAGALRRRTLRALDALRAVA